VKVEATIEIIKSEIEDRIRKEIKTKAKGKVEDALFVEMYYEKWEKRGIYGDPYDSWDVFILVRYPKEKLEKEKLRLQRNREESLAKAKAMFKKAQLERKSGEVEKAFAKYIKALELSRLSWEGDNLREKIVSSLKSLVDNIGLQIVSGNNQSITVGKGSQIPLVLRTFFYEGGEEIPISNIPVNIKILQGEGIIEGDVRTDREGIISKKIKEINTCGLIEVEYSLDGNKILPPLTEIRSKEDFQFLLTIVEALKDKKVNFNIEAKIPQRDAKIFLSIEEKNLGVFHKPSFVKESLISELVNKGWQLTDKNKADIIIKITAYSRFESSNYGRYFSALSSGDVEIIDAATDKMSRKKTIENVRGLSEASKKNAGLNSLKKLADNLSELVIEELMSMGR